MKNKKFYIASLILLIAAIIANGVAKGFAGRSVQLKVKSFSAVDIEKEKLSNAASSAAGLADTMTAIAFVVAMSGVLLWLISFTCKEPVSQFVPLILLIIFVLISLILV